ncbi:hypothetical protein [Dyella acidiphila]|uniref:Uncharacterized protein n=1 Tax=Dyella acidiphila TaxID=2775866 RepID=A0ABR9G756_9GAMM|nr:hypothetical protein [Dyella acidiphila]MBE1159849.1 hypothetical protein [Dyella acidiphila]
MKTGVSSMSSVVDFLEQMGSDARWRDASLEDIAQTLAEQGIEAPMCNAILAKDSTGLQALLGQIQLNGEQLPGPHEVPVPAEPEPEEEEEEDDETHDEHKAPHAGRSPVPSSSSSP